MRPKHIKHSTPEGQTLLTASRFARPGPPGNDKFLVFRSNFVIFSGSQLRDTPNFVKNLQYRHKIYFSSAFILFFAFLYEYYSTKECEINASRFDRTLPGQWRDGNSSIMAIFIDEDHHKNYIPKK